MNPHSGCCVRQVTDAWQITCCACGRWVAYVAVEAEAHEVRRLHDDVCVARVRAEVSR